MILGPEAAHLFLVSITPALLPSHEVYFSGSIPWIAGDLSSLANPSNVLILAGDGELNGRDRGLGFHHLPHVRDSFGAFQDAKSFQ